MFGRIKVPTNFGRELINSPVHSNLNLNLRDGTQLRVSSVILSLNSPVIDNLTSDLCQVMSDIISYLHFELGRFQTNSLFFLNYTVFL